MAISAIFGIIMMVLLSGDKPVKERQANCTYKKGSDTFVCRDCGKEYPKSAETNKRVCEHCFHQLMVSPNHT